MCWPGDSLACRSGFQFAKAHCVGRSCVTSRVSSFSACDMQLGFVKGVQAQLTGIFPSAHHESLHRTSEKVGKEILDYDILGYGGVKGKDARGFRPRYGKGGG